MVTLQSRSSKMTFGHRIRTTSIERAFSFVALAALALAIPVSANSRIRIDTVPSEYTPENSPTNTEPVSMSGYHFEVNEETQRARLVVEYTYPDEMIYGPNDDTLGPQSTVVQLPGLTYDAAARAVVYDSNGTRNICATVSEHHGLLGHHLKVKNTGACTVSTVVANHAVDDGWSIHRFRAIDTYLEVH
jgi:hypothetical protein